MWPIPEFPADLVALIEDIRNVKLHFLRSVSKCSKKKNNIRITRIRYCVKSACIRSFSGPYFPVSGLDTERLCLRIQSECRKVRTKKTPNTDIFHAVRVMRNMNIYGKNQIAEKNIEIPSLQRIWSHLLNKLLMENFIFLWSGYHSKPVTREN